MKPTNFKSLLVTAIVLFTCVSQSFAQESTYYHNSVIQEGLKTTCIYKMNEATQTLEKYKEATIIYDELNRPVNKTVRLWDERSSSWVPCQTFTYDYNNTECVINLKWEHEFAQVHNETYTYPLRPKEGLS